MKKKKLMLGLPILLIAGGAGAYMTGQLDPLLGVEPPAEEEPAVDPNLPPTGTVFTEIKDLGVSVIRNGLDYEVVYVDLALEVTAEAGPLVDHHWPKLLDRLTLALRELFTYRSERGLPPIDTEEMKGVILRVARHMFGDGMIVDAHLIADWVQEPGT
ncbi:MAG: hypothetical protein R3F55_21920 [Alphaproteobacteria bacterium]